MRILLLTLLIILSPRAADASCTLPESCGCNPTPEWAAILRWDAVDGGTQAVLERMEGTGPDDAGLGLLLTEMHSADAGTRVMRTSFGEERAISADGGIACYATSFEATEWTADVVSGACLPRIKKLGVRFDLPCHDHGCGCGADGPMLPLLGVALWVLARHRGQGKLRRPRRR